MMCQPFSGCINKEQKNMYMLYYNLYFFFFNYYDHHYQAIESFFRIFLYLLNHMFYNYRMK